MKRTMKIIILNIFESVKTGSKEILYNKTRSFLTILGITLGVMSLITMMGIVEGAKIDSLRIMNQYGGLNVIRIYPVSRNFQTTFSPGTGAKKNTLTFDDIRFLQLNACDIIQAISPECGYGGEICSRNISIGEPVIKGITPSFNKVNGYTIRQGRDLSVYDDWSLARTCVIGTVLMDELYPEYDSPVGEKIFIGGMAFTIVGVYSHFQMTDPMLTRNEASAIPGRKLPKQAITDTQNKKAITQNDLWEKYMTQNILWYKNFIACLPFSTMTVYLNGKKRIDSISVLLKDAENLLMNVDMIHDILKQSRGADDFRIETAEENYEMMNQQIGIFNLVLGSIAAISLVVGGIGIMNVILASISRRIREIGIRKSAGAGDIEIFIQFLIETLILSLCGGITGVLLSIITAVFFPAVTGLSISISFSSVLIAIFFCSFIGIISGLYPALKASRLDPVIALKYE